MTTYRGYEIEGNITKGFRVSKDCGETVEVKEGFKTEDAAMDWIDKEHDLKIREGQSNDK